MRPAIDGDALDIARRLETSRAKNTAELVADITLEGLERRLEQLALAGTELVRSGKARFERDVPEVQYDRLVGRC